MKDRTLGIAVDEAEPAGNMDCKRPSEADFDDALENRAKRPRLDQQAREIDNGQPDTNEPNFLTFPDELILKIMSFLSIEDVATKVSLVCRRFQELCLDTSLWTKIPQFAERQHMKLLESVERLDVRYYVAFMLQTFSNLNELALLASKNITELTRAHSKYIETGRLLEQWPPYNRLKADEKRFCEQRKMAEKDDKILIRAGLSYIELEQYNSTRTRSIFSILSENEVCEVQERLMIYLLEKVKSTVQDLFLGGEELGLALFQTIRMLPKLRSLSIVNLRASEFREISKLTMLEKITIIKMSLVESRDFATLFSNKKLENLMTINVAYCSFDDESLKEIAENCPQLARLTVHFCERVSDEGLRYILLHCHKLEHLNLAGIFMMTNRAFAKITAPLRELTVDVGGAYAVGQDHLLDIQDRFSELMGFMWDIAPRFHALLVFAEHRYYGKSLPFGPESLKPNPQYNGYLSSEQALADYAELITQLKREIKGADKSAVIVFGGSYGGMLAAWFRIKYPHICDGAIAASAPVAQFDAPCDAFGRIVTSDYSAQGKECSQTIRDSWAAIDNITASDAGLKWLSSEFKMCKPLEAKSVPALKAYLTDLWTNVAMMDYPYPTSFLVPLPGNPVKQVCKKIMKSKNQKLSDSQSTLSSIFAGVSVYFNYTGGAKCLDIETPDDIGSSMWDYQACTEMVMPFCYDNKNDMFEKMAWNYTAFALGCQERWKIQPRPDMADLMYGGNKLAGASNIVFSNGLLDPWSSGGILRTISKSVVALIIPEGAHHLDLRAEDPNDPPSVRKARELETQYIKKWIVEAEQRQNKNYGPENDSIIVGRYFYV